MLEEERCQWEKAQSYKHSLAYCSPLLEWVSEVQLKTCMSQISAPVFLKYFLPSGIYLLRSIWTLQRILGLVLYQQQYVCALRKQVGLVTLYEMNVPKNSVSIFPYDCILEEENSSGRQAISLPLLIFFMEEFLINFQGTPGFPSAWFVNAKYPPMVTLECSFQILVSSFAILWTCEEDGVNQEIYQQTLPLPHVPRVHVCKETSCRNACVDMHFHAFGNLADQGNPTEWSILYICTFAYKEICNLVCRMQIWKYVPWCAEVGRGSYLPLPCKCWVG